MRLRISLVLVCLALFALPRVVRADEAPPAPESDARRSEASQHFQLGVTLFREGGFRAALAELLRAYELVPDYRVLYNIAQTHVALADYVEATRVFEQYLQEGGILIEPRRRKEVETQLVELARRSATLTLTVDHPDAQISIDGVLIGASPLAQDVTVSLGRHTIEAHTRDGASNETTIDVTSGDHKLVNLVLAQKRATAALDPEPRPKLPVSPRLGRRTRWGIGLLASGIVLAGAGGATWLVSRQASDDYHHSHDARDQRRADQLVLSAEVLAATGAALTASSIVLFLTVLTELTAAAGETPRPAVEDKKTASLSWGVGPGTLSLSGRF